MAKWPGKMLKSFLPHSELLPQFTLAPGSLGKGSLKPSMCLGLEALRCSLLTGGFRDATRAFAYGEL